MEKQYVVFKLGSEEYGLDIMYIKEIIRFQKITSLPQSSEFIEGIINYRGKIIPILNTKKKFGMGSEINITDNIRIIVVNIDEEQIGLLVDEASQTIKIDDTNIETAPNMFPSTTIVNKIGKVENRLISIIDIKHIANEEELKVQ
jgi:purine-binding chemotaxis protein CheW